MFVTKSLQQLGKSVVRSSSALAAVVSTSQPTSQQQHLPTLMLSTVHKHVEFNFHANQLKLKILSANESADPSLSKSLPYIWLRANCMCSSCYNRAAEECEIDLSRTDVLSDRPVEIVETTSNDGTCQVRVIWSDGHTSEFELTELTRLVLAGRLTIDQNNLDKKILWNRDLLECGQHHGLLRLPYDAYMNDTDVLKQALSNVYRYGAVIVKNVCLFLFCLSFNFFYLNLNYWFMIML